MARQERSMMWRNRFLFMAVLLGAAGILLRVSPLEAAFDGPFTGRILDGETGKPIAGVSILVSWERFYRDPIVFHGSGEHWETAHMLFLSTNAKGEYRIPRVNIPMGLTSRLASLSLVIYEPGYEVHDARRDYIEHYGRRETFPPKGHLVRLKHVALDFDHAAHLKRIAELVPHLYLQRNRITKQWEPVPERAGGGYPAPEREEFLRRTAWEKVMVQPK